MKRYTTIFFLAALGLCATFRFANAAPCSAFDGTLVNGTFKLTHSVLSTKKPLKQMTVFEVLQTNETKRMLGDGAPYTLHHLYNVTNMQFETDITAGELALLNQINYVAMVTKPTSPDLCFLVWFSGDNQFLDANVILGQNGFGEMNLGSFSKLDQNLYMTMTRLKDARRR